MKIADKGMKVRLGIRINGVVQGVGFRPYIYRLANEHGVTGCIWNDREGVSVEAEGTFAQVSSFVADIPERLPPQARIESLTETEIETKDDAEFVILESQATGVGETYISPDLATCKECVSELFEPTNRRYQYPFTNCTNCGPRFTILQNVPYDRAATTMSTFPMCPNCQREYDSPLDRRFHAQPNACTNCGPQVQLYDAGGNLLLTVDWLETTVKAIESGSIIAVKGIGGFHLVCNATDEEAVERLRQRKHRPDQPIAIMAKDMNQVENYCDIRLEERQYLESPVAPIALLTMKAHNKQLGKSLAKAINPRQKKLGVMLPYSPLHHILLNWMTVPLVMTSGNISGMPMIHQNEDALVELQGIADFFLVHNRPIHIRCDDSVGTFVGEESEPMLIRRARGYPPLPIHAYVDLPQTVFAAGAQLKSTFCFGKDNRLYLSHYIGDLHSYETYQNYQQMIEHYQKHFHIDPTVIAYDLHPDYLSTQLAKQMTESLGASGIAIQHHEAHLASCLVDCQVNPHEPVIGVVFDGTGLGYDGTIWGGEFFTGSMQEGFIRMAHFENVPLPGGEQAIREPWRIAAAYLIQVFGIENTLQLDIPFIKRVGEKKLRLIDQMMKNHLNTPLTSSAGRLFDAIGAILDVKGTDRISYEGQCAIELEQLYDENYDEKVVLDKKSLHIPVAEIGQNVYLIQSVHKQVSTEDDSLVVQIHSLIEQIVYGIQKRLTKSAIATQFHNTIAANIMDVCRKLRKSTGIQVVALSGGVFQNTQLLWRTICLLKNDGFKVYCHHTIPANDGGIAIGQAVLAQYRN